MASAEWTKPARIDPKEPYDSPIPSSARANKTDGLLNIWTFYPGPDNYQLPEQRLMVAVLKDAIYCAYEKNPLGEKGKREQHEALIWIGDTNADATFSFNSVCEVLNIEPEFMRREIGKMDRSTK